MISSRSYTGLATTLLYVSLAGCGEATSEQEEAVVCTTELAAGIELEVRDAVTDLPIAEHAIGTLESGPFNEIMSVTGWESGDSASAYLLSGAHERPGIYQISLTVPGYESWSRSDIEVEAGICHVTTVRFTVRLTSETI